MSLCGTKRFSLFSLVKGMLLETGYWSLPLTHVLFRPGVIFYSAPFILRTEVGSPTPKI